MFQSIHQNIFLLRQIGLAAVNQTECISAVNRTNVLPSPPPLQRSSPNIEDQATEQGRPACFWIAVCAAPLIPPPVTDSRPPQLISVPPSRLPPRTAALHRAMQTSPPSPGHTLARYGLRTEQETPTLENNIYLSRTGLWLYVNTAVGWKG